MKMQRLMMAILCAAASAPAFVDHGFGPLDKPVEIPDVRVTRHDGAQMSLRSAFRSRRTAVQFVFMDCRTTCPLLASLYRNVEKKLEANADVELVSITVTPERDTPEKLQQWRKKFGASERWLALRSSPEDLPAILAAFGQNAPIAAAHSLQVFFVENNGDGPRYSARTTDLPRAATVAAALTGKVMMAGIASEAEDVEHGPAAVEGVADGEQLYYGGQVAARVGKDPISAQAARCANCHGASREGGSEGATRVSPLRPADLTQSVSRRGGPASSYTQDSFCTVLRKGVDPAGILVSSVMPRYEISDAGCAALWNYLTRPQR